MYAGLITTVWPNSAVRYYRLNIGGLDLLSGLTSFGVDRDSIDVSESGPGGVSSMTFTINDPEVEATFAADDVVEFWDIAEDRPNFLGFIQSMTLRPTAVGRYIDVVCAGADVVLDWMMVPNLTIPGGTLFHAAVQSLVANASGIGFGLRAYAYPDGSVTLWGDQAHPIGYQGFPLVDPLVVDGQSLREALQALVVLSHHGVPEADHTFWVDMYGGLRVVGQSTAGAEQTTPADYFGLLVGGAQPTANPTSLDVMIDQAGVARGVYIRGTTPAASGYVSDGSGVTGPISFLDGTVAEGATPAVTTAAIRNEVGLDYLVTFSKQVRGSVTFTVDPTVYPWTVAHYAGTTLTFEADSQTFAETTYYTVYSISKRFLSGRLEEWTVAFGGHLPSAVHQTRRLTRVTRS